MPKWTKAFVTYQDSFLAASSHSFGEFSSFSQFSPNVKNLGFLNIISSNSYLKGLLGWYKPEFDFSKLI